MLLGYEKEILESTSCEACLVVVARGLRYTGVVRALLSAYSSENSFAFILNMSEHESEYFSREHLPLFCDVNKLTARQRAEKYKSGGVFCGSSTVLATDFVNKNVQIGKISALLILNAEGIEQDSAISFICHLFRENNSLGLIKAFTSDAIRVSECGLEQVARSLCLNKILFYPRFHELVKASLPDIDARQVNLRQSELMGEGAMLVEDLIKKIYSSENRSIGAFDYMKVLICRQRSPGTASFKKLISLLFSADSLTAFLYYQAMIDHQKENSSDSSWIFDGSSYALLDVLRKALENDIEKSNEISASFILGIASNAFRLDLHLDKTKRNGLDTRLPQQGSNSEADAGSTNDESTNGPYGAELGQQEDAESDGGDALSEVLGSKLLSSFYLANPKIRQTVEILNHDPKLRTAILVQNRAIRKSVMRSLRSISVTGAGVFTHTEFLHLDDYSYERIILLNPDLQSIRNVEYMAARGVQPSVFILQYKNTVEEQRFLEEIREEKYAFEKIIEDRARLPLKVELDRIDMDCDVPMFGYKITVDSREMRSKLPFFLYKAGNEIEVRALDVGDYQLGTTKCIERKSVEDFLGSLNSGRLYQQA